MGNEPLRRQSAIQAIADCAEDFITLLGLDFRHLFANRALAQAVGIEPDEFVGKSPAELGIPPDAARSMQRHFEAVAATGQPARFEFDAQLVAGRRMLQSLVAPVKRADESVEALIVITRDITEWKRAETLRNSQHEVMRQIAGGAALPELLALMVRLVEETNPGRPCSILLLDAERRRLLPGHAPHVPRPVIDALCAEPVGPLNGCCGAAAHHGRFTVTADIATDPAWVRHRDVALAHGLRSCWSHPIVAKDGTLLGTFAMYHRKAREPYTREAAAVAEGATAAAIALQHWRAQDDLLETRERFQALTENAANIVIVTDMKGLIRFVSPAVTPILGRTPEEVLGQNAFSWLHPDDVPLARAHFRQLRDEVGAQIQSTCRYRHKDGSWRLLEVIGKSRLNHAGEYLAVVSGRDVTEREDAGQALRASQHQLNQALSEIKLLLEATDEGIVGLDSTGTIMFVNAAATRLLNLTAEELLGNSFDRLVRHTSEEGTDLIGHESLIVRCLLEGQRFRGSNELFWISETRSLPVEFSVSPVMADGKAQGAVLVFRDVSEKRALAQQLRFQALHDPLTGFSNRRGFEAKLTQLLGSARAQGREHALCYVDLDHFKLVNDTCGHAAGDELLRQLPAVLQTVVRRNDTISRLGGDEFAILLEDCPLERASRVAESVRDAVRNFRFVWQYRTFTIGASVGVVGITAESQGLVSVLGAADAACYVAKDHGPNHVHVSYPHDLAIIRRRGEMRWVARLKSALEENQMRLHFQSIAALDGLAQPPLKHELLMRLVDSRGELILPGAFQPAAERYQLMSSIDQWVVDHALRFLGRDVVPHRHLHGHRFGINLSGESLRDGRVVESIEEGLKRHGVPPTMLYFEVTETAAIANLGAAVEFIRRLKALGCQLALDDFGIGMSSFSYLKHLPVDYLKIDGSFVKDMVSNPVDQAIVRSVHAVSRQMGIETIAEYAESAAILDCLRDIGVNYAQGYAIARPRPLEEFAALQQPVAASA